MQKMSYFDLATQLKDWIDPYLWFVLSALTFIIGLIRTSPLNYNHEAHFYQIVFVSLRRTCLIAIPLLILPYPVFVWLLYTAEMSLSIHKTFDTFVSWYGGMKWHWFWPLGWYLVAFILRIYLVRYAVPYISDLKRSWRVTQKTETLTDIRDEKEKYKPKLFTPKNYYKTDEVLFGLNRYDIPLRIALKDWYESNMQILGPTRVGKGVLLGMLIDQAIRRGDMLAYIDPKGDTFIPHIMADTAREMGRLFIFLNLNDPTENEINQGGWAPFVGGDLRSRRARILTAFGMNNTGNESDFYKGRERKILDALLERTNGRLSLLIEEFEKSPDLQEKGQRLYASITEWAQIKSLCPKKDRGFSVEKSLLNNAVVYVKGSLDDEVVREATRILVVEFVQELRRLSHLRSSHATLFIDEMRFLTSNPLVDALATIAGFNANVVLAYQAKKDIRNLTDRSLNAEAIEQSVNTNCQLKFLYGSLDKETNKWAAEMSGELLKLITRSEHTKIGHLGQETWEHTRAVGQQEEALVTENIMLSLKSRVGVLFQPRELAQIAYTSFVPTNAKNNFSRWSKSTHQAVKQPSPVEIKETNTI